MKLTGFTDSDLTIKTKQNCSCCNLCEVGDEERRRKHYSHKNVCKCLCVAVTGGGRRTEFFKMSKINTNPVRKHLKPFSNFRNKTVAILRGAHEFVRKTMTASNRQYQTHNDLFTGVTRTIPIFKKHIQTSFRGRRRQSCCL